MKAIAAVDKNWGIGKGGELLYHIGADLMRFKELTCSNVVIMGSKTLLSLPGSKPLPKRENIILSRDEGLIIDGAYVVNGVHALLDLLREERFAHMDSFVIGGAQVYELLLPYCDTALITHIDAQKDADCFFPRLDKMSDWLLASKSEDLGGYAFAEYIRVNT